jgi:hypothetical protein
MLPLCPGKLLEKTIVDIEEIFQGMTHWLCFGGLWGLIRNRGIIRDADLDMCVFYGEDWEVIASKAKSKGYTVKKVMVNDLNKEKALYMGIYKGDIYICVSFWYSFENYFLWCHDQKNEVKEGVGTPQSGYFFKGCESWMVSDFMKVEWPGIVQNVKITVPVFAGSLLDLCYPAWPYLKQRYVIKNNEVDEEKSISVNDPIYVKGSREGAVSRYRVRVDSMKEFEDKGKINLKITEGIEEWNKLIKLRK